MKSTRTSRAALIISTTALASTPGLAESYNFRLASGVGTNHVSAKATEFWAEKVNELSEGRIDISLSYGGALLSATEVLPGVAEGRVDMGTFSSAWHPAELPLTYLSTVPFLTTDGEASVRTWGQMYTEDETLRREYERQGVHALMFQPLDILLIHGKTRFDSPESMDGTTIRGAGEWQNILPAVGAQPISIAYSEIYESLERGVMDGHGLNFEGIADIRVDEVGSYMADAGIGQVFVQPLVISAEIWESLSDEDKAIFEEASEITLDNISRIYREVNDPACERMVEGGAEFFAWSDKDKQFWKEAAGQAQIDSWLARQSDTASAEQFLADYEETLSGFAENSAWDSAFSICQSKQDS